MNKKLKAELKDLRTDFTYHDSHKRRNDNYTSEEVGRLSREIHTLKSKICNLESDYIMLREMLSKQDKVIYSLLNVVKVSGLIEEAISGPELFQLNPQVDMLQRNPLYKINKICKGE